MLPFLRNPKVFGIFDITHHFLKHCFRASAPRCRRHKRWQRSAGVNLRSQGNRKAWLAFLGKLCFGEWSYHRFFCYNLLLGWNKQNKEMGSPLMAWKLPSDVSFHVCRFLKHNRKEPNDFPSKWCRIDPPVGKELPIHTPMMIVGTKGCPFQCILWKPIVGHSSG